MTEPGDPCVRVSGYFPDEEAAGQLPPVPGPIGLGAALPRRRAPVGGDHRSHGKDHGTAADEQE